MTSPYQVPGKIISMDEYLSDTAKYAHLFEICVQPPETTTWQMHDEFAHAGTLFLGDLNLTEQETEHIEIHPFPEWVMKSFQPNKNPGKAYAVFPELSTKFIQKTLARKDFSTRIQKIQSQIDILPSEEYIAIEYVDGMCIKVLENVPHYFLSVVNKTQNAPFMLVFEPRIDFIKSHMGFDTPYFKLPFRLRIQ